MRRFCLFAGLMAIVCACGDSGAPTSPEIPTGAPQTREDRWRQDLGVLSNQLRERHADLFFKLPQAQFDADVDALFSAIPSLEDTAIVVEMMRLTASIGDAHTVVDGSRFAGFRRLPLRFEWFMDGIYLVAASEPHHDLVEGRLVRVGDASVEAVVASLRDVVAHENESWLRARLPSFLVIPEILQARGLVGDASSVQLELAMPNGDRIVRDVAAEFRANVEIVENNRPIVPLYRQRVDENYWNAFLEDTQTLYIQYRRAANQGGESVAAFSARMLAFLDENLVRTVVVDLRNNGGGSSSLLEPLIAGLERRPMWSRGLGLYTIIGKATFSSALLNAVSLAQRPRSILVGEPSGGKPNHFGEVRSFNLPNSGLPVNYSTRFFRVLQDSDPASLEPDIRVDIASEDFFRGRDPVLDRILDLAGR